MQEEPESGGPQDWREDEWVARLVSDPAEVPEVQVVAGFLGRGDRPGCCRIYLTTRLDEYVECREQDVLHVQALGERAPMGGSVVWLDRKAPVHRTQLGGAQAQAEFLQGDIANDFLSSARLQVGGLESDVAIWTIIVRVSQRICTKICPDTGPTTCVTCLVCNAPAR